jgi:hypothetical protein
MTYAAMGKLSDDTAFRDRVLACCTEQALIFKDDGRADMAALAESIIASQINALGLFELVCVSPSFAGGERSDQIEDPDILASVQANWPVYAGVVFPSEPAP